MGAFFYGHERIIWGKLWFSCRIAHYGFFGGFFASGGGVSILGGGGLGARLEF